MTYLIDANTMIESKNRFYRFDVVPGYWDWLTQAHLDGRLYTVEAVANEVLGTGDELSVWFSAQPQTFTVNVTPDDYPALQTVSKWTQASDFTQGAKADFLASADYFLVAQALARQWVVVTFEKSEPNRKKKIKIPEACDALGVVYVNPFDMLRQEKAKFTL